VNIPPGGPRAHGRTYAGTVTDGLLLLGAGLLGLVVGVVTVLAFRASERAQYGDPEPPPTTELSDDVTRLLELLPFDAVVTTTDLVVVRASAAARAHRLVIGDRVVNAVAQRLLSDVAADGESRDIELELPAPTLGRGPVPLRLRAVPLGLHHLLLLAEDRTEARRVEAARRDFVVNASHELKTPVGAIALLGDAVGAAADDPEAVRRFADRIVTESERLAALVSDILELSRVQSEGAFTAAEEVDVAAVVAEAVDRTRTTAASRGIAIESGGTGATVLGDHAMLVTAVRNLLDNAVTYSEPGTRVAVTTTVDAERGTVDVAVVDQGIGIPREAQGRIFERFYRVDPARSRDTGGTGLGLSIVKHVVADHGGEISVWSEPGHGSTFTVHLPLPPADPEGDAPSPVGPDPHVPHPDPEDPA
jgi:two-component system sensor histidine kinase SenX3